MIVDRLANQELDTEVVRSARVRWSGGTASISVRVPASSGSVPTDGSAFVAATLLAAMSSAEDLDIDGEISVRLADHVDLIATAYATWDPRLRPPRLTAAATTALAPDASATDRHEPATGCFFSRGVDSMYSAAMQRRTGAPTHLVYCDGVEPHHGPDTAAKEVALAHEAATHLGLPLLVVSTDVREFTDRFYGWGSTHGSALAAVAHSLGDRLTRMIIPTTDSFASIVPYGSSPVLDPLFSTERCEIVHDDLALPRVGKVAALAEQRPDLLPLLKVCFEHDGPGNCGRCGKCLLTMASLQAVGALDQATGFPDTIDLDVLRRMSVVPLQSRFHWVSVMRALGDRGANGAVRDAMAEALRRSARPPWRDRVRLLVDHALGRRASAHPSWRSPDRGFDWRFNAEVVELVTRGRPDRPLESAPEIPRTTRHLRPPG
jgi:hypothetical protein